MSTFENQQYRWRETYFVLFESSKRPSLVKLQQTISKLNNRFTLTNLNADESGCFESLTILSPDDFAALDICYLEGEEVIEQADALVNELDTRECQVAERSQFERIRQCNGRFDVLHFEQIVKLDEGDDMDDVLDPSALLVVLDALTEATGGIAIDPQTGTFL